MGQSTAIAWTDHTFNAVWGCSKVSEGCRNCYAAELAERTGYGGLWKRGGERRTFGPKYWRQLDEWNAAASQAGVRRRVFCGSMFDWAEDHPVTQREMIRLWAAIRRCNWLDFQLLTKRAERISTCLPPDWGDGYENVWLGTSIEDERVAYRADHLRAVPAVVRFVSYEPALGPLDNLDLSGIAWVIYGGESGPNYRPENKDWARSMRDRCRRAGVAFFHKQSAAPRTEMGIALDGEIVREYPSPRISLPQVPPSLY